jgi:hypothetical protein
MKDFSAGAAVKSVSGEGNKGWNSIGSSNHVLVRRVVPLIMFLVGFGVLWMFICNNSASPFGFPDTISNYFNGISTQVSLSLLLDCDVICLQLEFWVLDIFLGSYCNKKRS